MDFTDSDSEDEPIERKPLSEKEIMSKCSYDLCVADFYPGDLRQTRQGIVGTPLAEVQSVKVTPHKAGCKLYGRIQVDDCKGSVLIYDVKPENSHTLSSLGEVLLLSNRDRAIFADDHLTVSLDLKDKNGDVEFIRGSFSWNDSGHDKILVENIEGKLGSAQVSYIVHWAAVEANIWAQFNKEDDVCSDNNVDFELVARYKKRHDANHKDGPTFSVFKGKLKKAKNGGMFHLDRAVLTLPCHRSLVIQACVADDYVEAEYPIEDITLDATHKELKGKWGSVKVTVRAFKYLITPLERVDEMKIVLQRHKLFPEWLRGSAQVQRIETDEVEESKQETEDISEQERND